MTVCLRKASTSYRDRRMRQWGIVCSNSIVCQRVNWLPEKYISHQRIHSNEIWWRPFLIVGCEPTYFIYHLSLIEQTIVVGGNCRWVEQMRIRNVRIVRLRLNLTFYLHFQWNHEMCYLVTTASRNLASETTDSDYINNAYGIRWCMHTVAQTYTHTDSRGNCKFKHHTIRKLS